MVLPVLYCNLYDTNELKFATNRNYMNLLGWLSRIELNKIYYEFYVHIQ